MPLTLLIGLDDNWYSKVIHGHVCVFHTGDGYDNIFGPIQPFSLQNGIQTKITVIFWVTGKRIAAFDKQYYKYDVLVFWKNEAWTDRRVLLEWATTYIDHINSYHHIK